jgi:RNA polymerase subunit RPABC4/transcription elongation factor Spt4
MTLPSLDTIVAYSTFCFAIAGALLAAVWLSLVIWTFRDMRARSRDPFAHILATLVVAILPVIGLVVYLILRPRETLTEAYERALEEEALLQEIEEKPVCPGCSRTTDRNWLLCPHCHTRLRKACPDCNSLMELQWTLCPYCGNQHVDPYTVGPQVVMAEEILKEEDERDQNQDLNVDFSPGEPEFSDDDRQEKGDWYRSNQFEQDTGSTSEAPTIQRSHQTNPIQAADNEDLDPEQSGQ